MPLTVQEAPETSGTTPTINKTNQHEKQTNRLTEHRKLREDSVQINNNKPVVSSESLTQQPSYSHQQQRTAPSDFEILEKSLGIPF